MPVNQQSKGDTSKYIIFLIYFKTKLGLNSDKRVEFKSSKNDVGAKKVGFLAVSGRKSDFTDLEELQKSLRKVYPNIRTVDIQFTSDNSVEESNSIAAAAASLETPTPDNINPAIFSRSCYPPSSDTDWNTTSSHTATNSSDNQSLFNDNYLSESEIYRGFSGHCCHEDFASSPWCRGSWFCLRSGTAKLHAAAQADAVQLAEWNQVRILSALCMTNY